MKNSSALPSPVNASDAQLVAAARLGNRKAFVEIVHRYQNLVTGVTLAVLRDFSLGEDAAQEAFVLAWQKLDTLKDGEKLRPWLCQIARNTALNLAKKRRPEESLEPSLIDPSPRPDELAISRDEHAAVLSVLASLPEKYRLPLVLFYREDQSIKAVAQALSRSEDTIRQQLSRGRSLLKGQMEELLKSALPRTNPGPVFTATVAGLIGAMLKPTAVAATAFSAKPVTASATAMTASKLTLTTATVITAICLPIGYTARALISGEVTHTPEQITTIVAAPERESFDPALSPIAMEWRELLASCQNDPKAFPNLYETISQLSGNLRRETFHSLLLAEWVRLDPVAGLAFVRALDDSQWQQELFAKEWIKQDINAAIDGLLTGGPGWDFIEKTQLADIREGEGWSFIMGRQLNEIATRAPDRLKTIVEALPVNDFVQTYVAFAKYSAHDPKAARELANSFTGKRREQALGGIASGWSEKDLTGALAWAESNEDPALRASLVRAIISSLSWRNPLQALEYLKTAPPGMVELGGSAIYSLSEKDFPAALKWIAENPNSEFAASLNSRFYDRLRTDPLAFIDTLHTSGTMKNTAGVLAETSLLSKPGETRVLVWNRLLQFGDSPDAVHLRKEIVSRSSYEDPDQMIEMVDDLPAGQERESLIQAAAHEMAGRLGWADSLGRSKHEEEFFGIIDNAADDWRGAFIEEGFKRLRIGLFAKSEHLDRWESYFETLPDSEQPEAAQKLAYGIAHRSPDEMDRFFANLKSEEVQVDAGVSFVDTFSTVDRERADRWLADTSMDEKVRAKIKQNLSPWR